MPLPNGIDLDRCMRRVATEAAQDAIPDVINNADYVHAWPALREDLKTRVANGSYVPRPPEIVEVAKSSLVTRPITRLAFTDRVYYEALVWMIADQIDSLLSNAVFSSRLADIRRRRSPRSRGVNAWNRFNDEALELSERYEDAVMLSSDISSFFEYVDLPILFDELGNVDDCADDVLQELRHLLYRLSDNSDSWGLPQGHTASAILSNFYLLPLDALLLRSPGVEHVRYSDDLKLFSDSDTILRLRLRECITILRSRHLNVAANKTRLSTGAEIADELTDARKDAVKYGLEVGDTSTPAQLRAMFDEATTATPVNERDVAFSVYRLQALGDPHALTWILPHLHEVPYLASLLVPYLGELFDQHPEIELAVQSLLTDSARNIYPDLEQQLLRMLARARNISEASYRAAWAILSDEQKASYVRAFAARCGARHIRPGDHAALRSLFDHATDPEVRRALLAALYESERAPNHLLGSLAASDPTLGTTCDYLRTRPRLPPP